MTTDNVIQFPVPHRISDGTDDMLICWLNFEHLLEDLTSPYYAGWVESKWLCLQCRTLSEFTLLFELMGGGIGYGFTGFRDIAEGLLCEQAALSTGSKWRFLDYYRQDRQWGGYGLGRLALALRTYQRCCESGLYEGRLLLPPTGE